MESSTETRICNRCGKEITAFSPKLLTLSKIQKVRPSEYAQVIAELENVSIEIAKEWLCHESLAECTKKVGHCPFCGGELKTWSAKLCLHCHKSWHNQDHG
jgi:RecJ-like exonuclease